MKEDTDKVEAGRLREAKAFHEDSPISYWLGWATGRIDVLEFKVTNLTIEKEVANQEIERLKPAREELDSVYSELDATNDVLNTMEIRIKLLKEALTDSFREIERLGKENKELETNK